MLDVYRDKIVGAAPAFPARMEARITASLLPTPPTATTLSVTLCIRVQHAASAHVIR